MANLQHLLCNIYSLLTGCYHEIWYTHETVLEMWHFEQKNRIYP